LDSDKRIKQLLHDGENTLAVINNCERAASNGVQKLLPHWARNKRAYQEILKTLAPLVGCNEKQIDKLIKGRLN